MDVVDSHVAYQPYLWSDIFSYRNLFWWLGDDSGYTQMTKEDIERQYNAKKRGLPNNSNNKNAKSDGKKSERHDKPALPESEKSDEKEPVVEDTPGDEKTQDQAPQKEDL